MSNEAGKDSRAARVTRSIHMLPFERLSWMDFERLCLWLVKRSGFSQAEHTGAAGLDSGRDIIAIRDGQKWVFQCKRVRRFGPAEAVREVKKLIALPEDQRPHVLVFIVTCAVSARTRMEVRNNSAGIDCQFWSETDLDEKVKRHPFIMNEFFENSGSEINEAEGAGGGTAKVEGSGVSLQYASPELRTSSPKVLSVDFAPYLSQLIESFERDDLSQHYLDLYYSQLEITVQVQSARPQLLGTWRDREETIDRYFYRWLESSSQRQLSILGEFGSGKTSFCKHIAYVLAKAHLANPDSNRIPVLISLKNGRQLGTVEKVISRFFRDEWGLEVNRGLLPWLAKAGRLVLILDGFDEMAARVDKTVRRESFELISRLAQAPSKVVVTGRSGYFPTLSEMCEIFGRDLGNDSYHQIKRSLLRSLGSNIEFEILRVNPLSERQIDEMLRSYDTYFLASGFEGWQGISLLIDKIYNLRDLATRPILLDLIIKTIPQLSKTQTSVNISRIYELYTDYWCDVEWHKGEVRHLQTSEERRSFMRFLACEMFWSERKRLHFSELPNQILRFYDATSREVNWLEHDIRTCTFLKLSDDGVFEFVHASFLEYFLASALIIKAIEGDLVIHQEAVARSEWNLEKSFSLTDGAISFLKALAQQSSSNNLSRILFYNAWAWARTRKGLDILWVH